MTDSAAAKTRKPRVLRDLVVTEVSLVTEGANPEAKIVIAKAKGFKPCADCEDEKVCKAKGKCGGADDPKKIAKALNAAVSELAPEIAKAAAAHLGDFPDAESTLTTILKEQTMDMEQLAAALETAQAENTALKAEIAKAKTTPAVPDEVSVKLAKQAETLANQTVIIAKLLEERDLGAAIEKAKALNVGDPAKLGPILMRIEKNAATADDVAGLTEILKTAGAQAAANLRVVGGRLGTKAPDAGANATRLDAIAKTAATEGGAMKAHIEVAKALTENPALYDEWIRTNPSRAIGE